MMPAVGVTAASNQELTEQIVKMQKQLASFEEQLHGLIMPMQEEISKSREISDQVTDQLNQHILP